MLLTSGAMFARYKVEASLGDGGMGQVYQAFDTQLHRRIALKLLNPPSAEEKVAPVAAALLLREARAAAALNHINAVMVFEVGEHDGVPFMAMELVEGHPLRHLIGRSDVTLQRRIQWLVGIANALGAAHAAGIVHLDVKPENVIIRADDVPKVLDFGIARRRAFDPELAYPTQQDAQRMHNLTGGGAIAGTPRYMAPEQIGRMELDGRADQFAWGVVAYELLTGRSPWPLGDDLYTLFTSIVRSTPTPVHRLRTEVPEALSVIIARAMSKKREDRYATMNALVGDLTGVLDEMKADARGPLSAASLRPFQPVSAAEAMTLRAGDAITEQSAPPASALGTLKAQISHAPISLRVDAKTGARVDSEQLSLPGLSSVSEAARRAMSSSPDGPISGRPSDPTGAPISEGGGPRTQRSVGASADAGKRRFTRAAVGAAALVTAALGTWLALRRPQASVIDAAPASASQCNEPATRAYSAGSRALRSGNWEVARKSFNDAAAADPECAPAHAKLVVIGYWTDQPSKTRESMRRAVELKSRLSQRDQSLLKCYEHVLWATPPDERSFASCLEKLSEASPGDPELAYIASDFAPDPTRQRELAQRALDIDPEYSDAWQGLAAAYERQDNEQAALDALDKCVAHVTTSVDCLAQRAAVLTRIGRCEELEKTGRAWIARSPEAIGGHFTLGAALSAQGKAPATVEEALAPRWAKIKGTEDAYREQLERAALATLQGDLAKAVTLVRDVEALTKTNPDMEPRIDAALWQLDLGEEAADLAETGKLAQDLWSRKAAWDSGQRRVGFNTRVLQLDPLLLRVMRLTKRMPDAEWTTAREKWVADSKASGALGDEGVWVLGYAMQVETPEDASEALKTMPPSIVTTTTWTTKLPGLLTFAYAGRTLALAGRADEGIRLLKRATTSCSSLDEPMLHTRVHAWLAAALEKKGDKDGACAALSVVTKRWDPATWRTAKASAERAKALGCTK
ncbi:MAG: protein kinase [Polyangiaceae bacterium]